MDDFDLPEELIAQEPVTPRDNSRMMVVKDKIYHNHFYDIIDYLETGDCLVINNTKVKKAKLCGEKSTGSAVEVILSKKISETRYVCRVKTRNPEVGNIYLFDGLKGKVVERDEALFTIEFNKPPNDLSLPIPPYVNQLKDESKYQTVFCEKNGSLASPTAGLHFTPELIDKIQKKGIDIVPITLNIDFATFLPVVNIDNHIMHTEEFEVPEHTARKINNRKGRLIVVGTTSLRTLESSVDANGDIVAQKGKTNLFITPGYNFKTKPDILLTNFHFPKSTLLMLVSAFAGKKRISDAYKEATNKRYRFYSLGDCMLLYPKQT